MTTLEESYDKLSKAIVAGYRARGVNGAIQFYGINIEFTQKITSAFRYSEQTKKEMAWFDMITTKFEADFSWENLQKDILQDLEERTKPELLPSR